MTEAMTYAYLSLKAYLSTLVNRVRVSEHGEGVISAAIAVLVMAFIGAAMWAVFSGLFNTAAEKTKAQVNKIGG